MAFEFSCINEKLDYCPDAVEKIKRTGIDPEFVIARSKKGDVISLFKDDVWDYTPYGASSKIWFDSWWDSKKGSMDALARTLTDEVKTIHWLSGFEPTSNAGRSRGLSFLYCLAIPLRALAKMCHALGITLAEAEHSKQFQVALRISIKNAREGFNNIKELEVLLKDLNYWQGVEGIACSVPRIVPEADLSDVLAMTQKAYKLKLDSRDPTPLIPTRLFGKLIGGALSQLKAVEPFLPRLEAFIQAVYADPLLLSSNYKEYAACVRRVKRVYPDKAFPTWRDRTEEPKSLEEALEWFELTDYFEHIQPRSLRGITEHITHLQGLCALLIHAFTGMRQSEVQVMPYEPVIHPVAKGFGDVPVLVSHLKKFSDKGNYSKPLVWATAEQGLYAVKIAQQLSLLNWFRSRPADAQLPSNVPLFIAPMINRIDNRAHYAVPISNRIWSTDLWRSLVASLDLVIEAEDMKELDAFDAFRGWDKRPEFAVGELWPLSSHQMRRSVAVYASRSGMVSLPALKTHFKHLSEVMTAVYAEGSSFAKHFLMDEHGKPIDASSVLSSFRDSVAFNTSVRFHEQVIKSHTSTYGPVGGEIQRAKDSGRLPKMLESREATEKAIKQGKFAYKETPVGGCTLKGSCPHFAVDVVLPCTRDCKDAILKREKLEVYVDSLRFDMKGQSPNSKPYQLIADEIEHVTKTHLEPEEIDTCL